MHRRYMGRKEYFGSLFFDRHFHRLLPFDAMGTAILEGLSRYSVPQVLDAFSLHLPERDILRFIDTWRREGLIDDEGRPATEMLPDRSQDGFLCGPVRVYLDLTSGCNLRCLHCVSASGGRARGELTSEEFARLFAHLRESGVFEINVGGGEPLSRSDSIEILKCAGDAGLSVALTTNATLIDRKLAHLLAQVDLKYIAVSLDGASPETHDYIRGKGTFKRVRKSLDLLASLTSHRVNAHFTLMRHNLHELKSFFTLAEELPAESLGVMVMRPSGRAVENSDLLLTKDEYRQAVRSMMEYAASCRKSAHLLPFLPGMDADGPSRLYSGFGCGAARVTCHIDASGNACPCNYFAGDLEKENVLDRGLLTVWAENPFFRRLRNLEGSSQCKSCRHFRDCRGGCRAQAQHFHGLLDAPDYYCM